LLEDFDLPPPPSKHDDPAATQLAALGAALRQVECM